MIAIEGEKYVQAEIREKPEIVLSPNRAGGWRGGHGGAVDPETLGGQQQMVAIGRALMANPEVILFDEISLGLAPIIINDIYAALPRIKGEGMSVVIVEQDISRALAVSNRAYCMQEGRVSLEGSSATLSRDDVNAAYFGV